MFNLVATVLAVIVMIAVAAAGLSYLGPAFDKAATRAVVAQVLNGGAQIDGAQSLRAAENGGDRLVDAAPGSAVDALVADGYLAHAPAVPTSVAAPGAAWSLSAAAGRRRPVLTLELDESRPGLAAFCAEMAKAKGFGCTTDLSAVGAR